VGQRSGMTPDGPGSVLRVHERHVMLNLGAARRRPLFESARALIGDEEPRGPALIVAQAAVEVACETMIDFAMQMRQVYEPLRQWVTEVPVRSWSPQNDRVQSLWKALTDDTITQAPSWSAYAKGVKRRHDFAHWASPVSREEAEAFVDAAEQFVEHMAQVMADTFPDPVEC
jgi:hypothetical protein